MTVEHSVDPDAIRYAVLPRKMDHPSALKASVSEEGELKNISLRTLVASKYTQLNETVLEALGLLERASFAENSTLDYNALLKTLEGEVASLKSEGPQDSKRSEELDNSIEAAVQGIPAGKKLIPKSEPAVTVHLGKFKSESFAYESASAEDKQKQLAVLTETAKDVDMDAEQPAKAEVTEDVAMADAPPVADEAALPLPTEDAVPQEPLVE